MYKKLFVLLLSVPMFAMAFEHKEAEIPFLELLKKVKQHVPEKLLGYQSATFIDGAKSASGNFLRISSLQVDLEKKTITLKVVEPPKKGPLNKTGTLTLNVYLENSKVWIEQRFERSTVGNWKLPVNVVGDTLQAPAGRFQYEDQSPAAVATRKSDLTYNLKQRVEDAGFSETPSTQYSYVFGFDSENKGVFMDQVISGLSVGEKDVSGNDLLKTVQVRISVTEKMLKALED